MPSVFHRSDSQHFFLLEVTASIVLSLCGSLLVAQTNQPSKPGFRNISKLLQRYCQECHSGPDAEAEFDLRKWKDPKSVLQNLDDLKRFESIIKSGQMPPKDSKQPDASERKLLANWSYQLLLREAKKFAGDPGPTTLRRLSNAEYDYTIRDLTGIASLNPTLEFPVDGAAGEGFTNTGSGQAMSPALAQKYFEAAKEISKHAVLLPNGLGFSPYQTERDRVDHYLDQIRAIYKKHTENIGSTTVEYQGYRFESNGGGRLPLFPYIRATIEYRDFNSKRPSIQEFAKSRQLSTKYFLKLWTSLSRTDESTSTVMNLIRHQWRQSTLEEADVLVSTIARWQSQLWRFNSIGHLGKESGPKNWLQAINPESTRRSIQVSLPQNSDSKSQLILSSNLLGKNESDIRWIRPRLVDRNKNELLLRDLASLSKKRFEIQQSLAKNLAEILRATREVRSQSKNQNIASKDIVAKVARQSELQVSHLRAWLDFVGIRTGARIRVAGHYRAQIKNVGGQKAIRGWGSHATPSVLANSSDKQFRIPGIMPPKAVVVHPSPTLFSACAWQSPIEGEIRINASISDQHPECGNGVEWTLKHEGQFRSATLWSGEIPTAKSASMKQVVAHIKKGDLVSFYIGPRSGNHACDLTRIDLKIESTKTKHVWDLAESLSKNILQSNPLPDKYKNQDVWHLYKGNWADLKSDRKTDSEIPVGSFLDQWLQTKDEKELIALEKAIANLLSDPESHQSDKPNRLLAERILVAFDPLQSEILRMDLKSDPRFGSKQKPGLEEIPDTDLIVGAGRSELFPIPTDWFRGASLVAECEVIGSSQSSPVQIVTSFEPINKKETVFAQVPITVNDDEKSIQKLFQSFDDFRRLFPPAVCYEKIVPVDEVVTLTLFHRDDYWLRELILNDAEQAQLNRLWDELIFVAKEPLKKVVALEQIYQFATQDRPDLVNEFKKLFDPTQNKADEFRKRQSQAEKLHLRDVEAFAKRAWRRPLTDSALSKLRSLYQQLIEKEIGHQKAIELLLTRILISPDFLYRRESVRNGTGFSEVTSHELAARLSYFLWSSMPDEELARLAEENQLSSKQEINRQAKRLLQHANCRRLALNFACQWLHVRDFDQNDDKNEKLFPEFKMLRNAMHEETVRYFEYMFRENRSILEMVDSDFTFANPQLAKHYGWPITDKDVNNSKNPRTDQWRKFEKLNQSERGGVLAMASILASQSGASRTSPILRGTWVSETLLGERLPKPPPDVPQLPDSVPSGLTARQLIEKHSSVPACAKCHARIDPYGFALEQFDVMGRIRAEKAKTKTQLFDGQEIDGLAGLKSYILNQRKDDFVRQFCKKLLGFALGRETQLSDEPLLLDMMKNLKENDYRFHSAVETIVTSDQFRSVRDSDYKR